MQIVEFNEITVNEEGGGLTIKILPSGEPAKGEHSFGMKYSYQVDTVEPNPESPLKLSATVEEDENLIQVNVKIENTEEEEKGMLICLLSVPTGCKVNLNDLEGLRLNSIVDFYELRRDSSEIVLYWRGLPAEGSREFSLPLLSEFNVENRVSLFVSTYLYYDKDGSLICYKI